MSAFYEPPRYRKFLQGRLQQNFSAIRRIGRLFPIQGGWLRNVRRYRKRSVKELANALGVTPSAIFHLEENERAQTISIKSMKKVASALDCDVVIALIPNEFIIMKEGAFRIFQKEPRTPKWQALKHSSQHRE